jgi:hypothetical protein
LCAFVEVHDERNLCRALIVCRASVGWVDGKDFNAQHNRAFSDSERGFFGALN